MADAAFMQHALRLAERGLGQTWPNPTVGAVVVKEGRIISTGTTARGGRPHAETLALAVAGEAARGATLYVTLEPCTHHGQTPPCTNAIIAANISRVVIACGDPNPQVNGNGIAALQQAAIEVITGVCEAEAHRLNVGFFSTIQCGKPFVALKLATSLDGKIATASGESRWITGEQARAYGHLLRSRFDGILTGSGTVLVDNPELTCRLPGLEDRSPQRIVLDRRSRLPPQAKIMQNGETWVEREYDDLSVLLASLAKRGITRLLVEAGQKLSTAFLREQLVDELYWFQAPVLLGGNALPALDEFGLESLTAHPRWRRRETRILGPDLLHVLDFSAARA